MCNCQYDKGNVAGIPHSLDVNLTLHVFVFVFVVYTTQVILQKVYIPPPTFRGILAKVNLYTCLIL